MQKNKKLANNCLETANIKLSSVLSDVFGKTGSQIIEDIARGKTDPKKLVKHIVGPIKNKTEDFMRAFTGRVTSHHCFMIQQSLNPTFLDLVRNFLQFYKTRKKRQKMEKTSEFCEKMDPHPFKFRFVNWDLT